MAALSTSIWRCAPQRAFSISATWASSKFAGAEPELLERSMTNSAARLHEPAGAVYAAMCTPRAAPSTISSCIASARALHALRQRVEYRCRSRMAARPQLSRRGFRDLSEETGLVAVQGPKAIAILKGLLARALAAMPRFGCRPGEVARRPMHRRADWLYRRGRLRAFRRSSDAAEALFSAILEARRTGAG